MNKPKEKSKKSMEGNKKILVNIKDKPYFSRGNFVLYNSDCLKILEQLPENSVENLRSRQLGK